MRGKSWPAAWWKFYCACFHLLNISFDYLMLHTKSMAIPIKKKHPSHSRPPSPRLWLLSLVTHVSPKWFRSLLYAFIILQRIWDTRKRTVTFSNIAALSSREIYEGALRCELHVLFTPSFSRLSPIISVTVTHVHTPTTTVMVAKAVSRSLNLWNRAGSDLLTGSS